MQTETTTIQHSTTRNFWKQLAHKKAISKADVITLCAYRTLLREETASDACTRLKRAFKPITNQVKLANGAHRYGALEYSKYAIERCQFMQAIPTEQRETVCNLALQAIKDMR